MRQKNIEFTKAKIMGYTIRIFSRTPADFRTLINALDVERRAYYTYTLNEDKLIHAVIKGFPKNTTPAAKFQFFFKMEPSSQFDIYNFIFVPK